MTVTLPADYRPSPDEEYMNPRQLAYFRSLLLAQQAELEHVVEEAQAAAAGPVERDGDSADQANAEVERDSGFRNRERARLLLTAVHQALARIEAGTYGYCDETGEPIGLKRLEAAPTAVLSVEAQERRERAARPG